MALTVRNLWERSSGTIDEELTNDNIKLSVARGEALELVPARERAVSLAKSAENARGYVAASRSANTIRAYRTGWAQFEAWCELHVVNALPASSENVAFFVADLAEVASPATIDARLAAISAAHRAAGYESPTKSEAVRLVRRGVRRTKGTAQRQVRPISVAELRRMVSHCSDDLVGKRDRVLLLLGFAGALRRSELTALAVGDVQENDDGLVVRVGRSKTDQEGAGRTIGVPFGSHPDTCPVRAWRAWIRESGISAGPAFRAINRHGQLGIRRLGPGSVAAIVKHYAELAGIEPDDISGHSLRAGLATAAAAAGVPERVIAQQTGHRSVVMVRRYVREGSLFRENAAAAVGL